MMCNVCIKFRYRSYIPSNLHTIRSHVFYSSEGRKQIFQDSPTSLKVAFHYIRLKVEALREEYRTFYNNIFDNLSLHICVRTVYTNVWIKLLR